MTTSTRNNSTTTTTSLTNSSSTNTIIQWSYPREETVRVTMAFDSVQLGEWRAVGFSLDRSMV